MTSEPRAYFEHLMRTVDRAVKVPFRQVQVSEWQPQLNNCHRNTDYWVAQNPDSKTVRGWLFWPPNPYGQYMFMAHSVIEEAGELVDITPIDQNTPRDKLLFLRHVGGEEDFNAMKIVCSQVWYPTLPWETYHGSDLAPSE